MQRLVHAVGQLALQRDAGRAQRGVERHPEHLDVFGVLREVLGGLRVLVGREVGGLRGDVAAADHGVARDRRVLGRSRERQVAAVRERRIAALVRAQRDRPRQRHAARERGRGRDHRRQGADRIAEAGDRAGAAADERQLAVVVDVVEAELGARGEFRQEPAQRRAVLALVVRVDGRPARHGLEVGDQRAAERPEVHAMVGERAEAEDHLLAAARHEVVAGEIGPDGFRLRAVPVEDADDLAGHVLAERVGELEDFLRQVGLAQLGARHAQRRHVEVVDRVVDAALDEGALAPVHDLAAGADLKLVAREVPAAVDEGVEQARVGAREVLAGLGDRRALGVVIFDLVVVERRAAHEQAVGVAVHRELGHQLERARGAVHVVVQVAVVDVRRAPGAAVRGSDQARVALLVAPQLAVGNRRVEGAVPAPGVEIERGRRARPEEPGGECRVDANAQRMRDGSRESLAHVVPQGRTGRCFPQGYISGLSLQCKTRPVAAASEVNCG